MRAMARRPPAAAIRVTPDQRPSGADPQAELTYYPGTKNGRQATLHVRYADGRALAFGVRQVAIRVGVTGAMISYMISGSRTGSVATQRRLAAVLGVTAEVVSDWIEMRKRTRRDRERRREQSTAAALSA